MIIDISIIKKAKIALEKDLQELNEISKLEYSFNGQRYLVRMNVKNPMIKTLQKICQLPKSINGHEVVYEISG